MSNNLKLLFDIETDGLLTAVTKVHCIVVYDFTSQSYKSFYDSTTVEHETKAGTIAEGVALLLSADALVGHNIISYDIPVLQKLFNVKFKAKLEDTLILSRLVFPHRAELDYALIQSRKLDDNTFRLPSGKKAVGSHALKAWGLRLGELKDTYGETTDWVTFELDMLTYCLQDVKLNHKLYLGLLEKNTSEEAFDLECKVAEILFRQNQYGILFDSEKAERLYIKLAAERRRIEEELVKVFPGWWKELATPEYYACVIDGKEICRAATKGACTALAHKLMNKTMTKAAITEHTVAGPLRKKHTPFNPRSDAHKARVFMENHGWNPQVFTEKGNIKIDSDILSNLPYPEAKLLLEYDVVQDRIEKIAEGKDGGYLSAVRTNGRIHGQINSIGTGTFRCSHSKPQLGQVPANYSPYGAECRELFIAPEGKKLVGTDASSLELRCLAHELAAFDGGECAQEVTKGDIHSANVKAFELDPADPHSRDLSKKLLYTILYGAGVEKIGVTVSGDITRERENKSLGSKLKNAFKKNIPAYAMALDKFTAEFEKNKTKSGKSFILGLDGRKVHCRSPHSTLNFRLQSAGAILTKRWMVLIDEEIRNRGWESRVNQLLYVHDELQLEVAPDIAEEVGEIAKRKMEEVAKFYNFKCPLAAEYKIGNNWKETH